MEGGRERAQKANGEGHRQRLRARFTKVGLAGFSDHEVVELLLTLAIPRRDVKPQAKALLQRFGSIKGVLDASPEELRSVPGMGEVAPVALRIVREAASLYLAQGLEAGEALRSATQIERYWRHRLGGLPIEVFEVGYTDSAFRLLSDFAERVEEGEPGWVVFSPRRVVEGALRRGATGIILVHNHPGGRAEPSAEDRRLTDELVRVTLPLGLRVIDHLIIADADAFSFRRAGLIADT